MCLVCGYVGCGRYTGGHAVEHGASKQHNFAMELDTQRVWDYEGDGYVIYSLSRGRAGLFAESWLCVGMCTG